MLFVVYIRLVHFLLDICFKGNNCFYSFIIFDILYYLQPFILFNYFSCKKERLLLYLEIILNSFINRCNITQIHFLVSNVSHFYFDF